MTLGVSRITADNVKEFRVRWSICNRCGVGILYKHSGGDRPPEAVMPTDAEIRAFVGLQTNADNLTRKQFLRQVISGIERDAEYYLKLEAKKEADNAQENQTSD